MKQIVATGCFFLLLLNMLGQSMTVWFIEELHENPATHHLGEELVEIKIPLSIPYGTNWQNDAPSGLIRYGDAFYNIMEQRYENDSLYTLMQANLSAREQFFALADRIQQEFGHDTQADGPMQKGVKLFSSAFKHYLSVGNLVTFFVWELLPQVSHAGLISACFSSLSLSPLTPPPDAAA